MRKNQKGFTLVELIIAVAILAVVTLAVCGFIVVGSRSYTSANTDIMLQQEAQLALNQISDVIIDTTDSINYSGKTAAASEMQSVLKDSEFNGEPTEKCLAVVNTNDTTSNNKNPSYWFYWSKDDETIYFNEVNVDSSMSQSEIEAGFNNAATDRAILAQHVKELHIDISQFEENRVVMISMTFQNGNKEYTTSNNVTVRNRVAINKIDIEPMKKAQEFTITTVKNVTLEPGDNFNLADKTQIKTTSGDDAVKWELVDPGNTTSTISSDGQLSIGIGETRQSFSVRVSRVDEEYANQNNKVARTVKVNIKRVNNVDLSCSETTIKAGNTVTVNGIASGYLLGASCEAHSCLTDEESKDHDLVPSRWRIVRGPATIVDDTRDAKKVEIKISTSAKKGDEIEIEATSDLSTRKSYGMVTGTLILKVTEGTNGAKFIGSELKYGTDNDPGIFDYMRAGLETDYWRYVVCMRAREEGVTTAANDRVVLYFSTAANVRFNPDIFGFDLDKTYNVYFQVLDPVSFETRQNKAENKIGSLVEDAGSTIAAEYLANVDDNGKYVGEKYPAGELFYGVVKPPQVTIIHSKSGITYPNDNPDFYERYSLLSQEQAVVDTLGVGDILNIEQNLARESLRFSVYRGDGNDPGQWEPLYIYQEKDGQIVATGNRSIDDGTLYVEGSKVGNSNFLKRNRMNPPYDPKICATYHIVPGFLFQNNPFRNRTYEFIIAPDYNNWDFNMHYYDRFECAVDVKVELGLNMDLAYLSVDNNGNQTSENWKTRFSLPTDGDFGFALKQETEQSRYVYIRKYSADGNEQGNLGNVLVKCKYLSDSDTYQIELLSESAIQGKIKVTTHYGTYRCRTGDDKWTTYTPGRPILESLWGTCVTFSIDGKSYKLQMPLPSESEFPLKQGESKETVRQVQYYEASDLYGYNAKSDWSIAVCYEYDSVTGIYKVSMQKLEWTWDVLETYGTWTCTRNGTKWDVN